MELRERVERWIAADPDPLARAELSLEPRTLLVEARVHGRVLVLEAAAGGDAPLLLGFHGYGENAERSLADLRAIPAGE